MKNIDTIFLKEWVRSFIMRNRTAVIVGVIVVVLAIIGFVVFRTMQFSFFSDRNMIDGRNAYDIALLRAREWHADALMDRIDTNEVGDIGKARQWRVTFVSGEAKGIGLVVDVADRRIISATEIPYVGTGADFPIETISQQEAIRRVRMMRGYENEPILGVEAVYGPAGQVWYWGVRTAKGIISVQAK